MGLKCGINLHLGCINFKRYSRFLLCVCFFLFVFFTPKIDSPFSNDGEMENCFYFYGLFVGKRSLCLSSHTHLHTSMLFILSSGPGGPRLQGQRRPAWRLQAVLSCFRPLVASHICLMHTSRHEVMRWECDREQRGLWTRQSLVPTAVVTFAKHNWVVKKMKWRVSH